MRRQGFTLIEVMIALVVIAVALSAIIRTVGNMTSNTAYLQQKTYAHWVAMNRITELRFMKAWPSPDTSSDEVEAFGLEWKWTQKVSEVPNESRLRQVKVSVIRADGDEDYPLATLTFVLLNPSLTQ